MPEGIAYQNKDIEFKLMSETYKEKSFEAYGLKLPKIKEVLPTNLPAVSANEMRIDNLFLLEDDTVAIVDYESEDKTSNRVKYINYIGRIMQRYDSQGISVDQHIIIWHFRRIKLCRNNAGIFHPRTPGILVITVIEKIITVITRLKMGYFNFPDSANYGIK